MYIHEFYVAMHLPFGLPSAIWHVELMCYFYGFRSAVQWAEAPAFRSAVKLLGRVRLTGRQQTEGQVHRNIEFMYINVYTLILCVCVLYWLYMTHTSHRISITHTHRIHRYTWILRVCFIHMQYTPYGVLCYIYTECHVTYPLGVMCML